MLGRVTGWLWVHWLTGATVAASLLATTSAVAWTVTPVAQAGQVLDAAGQPVAGATIATTGGLLAPSAQTRSDASGRYRVGAERWPYSPTALTVRAPGFLDGRTTGGRLVLHRWPRVTGQVLDDTGTPVPGAVVTFTIGKAVVQAAMADLDGRFAVELPPMGGSVAVAGWSDEHDSSVQEAAIAVDSAAAVKLALPRQFGKLHVESDPAGQAPVIDGQPAPDCTATPCDATVLAGAHQVTFSDDLFQPWEADTQVAKGDTAPVSAKLVRKTGTLTVSSPVSGELTVDGQSVSGQSWSAQVPTGQHTISLRSASTWPFFQQVNVTWNQTTQAALAPSGVSGRADAAGFTNGLRALLSSQGGGSYGAYLEELGSGSTIGVGDTQELEAASVIKVPEAVYLLHQVDAGSVKLDDQVTLQAGDFMSGTGSLYGTAHPGDTYTYQQLLNLLIQQSDNSAWLALRRMLTDSSIDEYAASIGAGDCSQVSDNCSARSAGHVMAELARGHLLSASSTSMLLQLLETTIYNDRINWYLSGSTIAHKVGMDGSVRNDCGVVFLSNDPFAICVFTTVSNPDQGIQVIRDIARAAAWHYSH